jgi:hypothetical protein
MMGVWDDLEKRLVIDHVNSLGGVVVLKPRLEDLDRFERESGFKLPDSYREFVLTFGPGCFDPGFYFYSPGFPSDRRVDLAAVNHSFKSQKSEGLYQSFFRFCNRDDFHGSWGWDPEDVTDPDTHEYGVYLLQGEGYDGPHRVASTFHEFVVSYVFGGGFEREEEPWKGEHGEQRLPDSIGFFQIIH